MRNWFLFFAVAVGSTLLVIPSSVEAQGTPMCNGKCWTCSGGHDVNVTKYTHLVNSDHGCGGPNTCDVSPHNEQCDKLVMDVGIKAPENEHIRRLDEFEALDGAELYRIAMRWRAVLYLNEERQALQQLDCKDFSTVVAHLPLTDEQFTAFLRVRLSSTH